MVINQREKIFLKITLNNKMYIETMLKTIHLYMNFNPILSRSIAFWLGSMRIYVKKIFN